MNHPDLKSELAKDVLACSSEGCPTDDEAERVDKVVLALESLVEKLEDASIGKRGFLGHDVHVAMASARRLLEENR